MITAVTGNHLCDSSSKQQSWHSAGTLCLLLIWNAAPMLCVGTHRFSNVKTESCQSKVSSQAASELCILTHLEAVKMSLSLLRLIRPWSHSESCGVPTGWRQGEGQHLLARCGVT